MKSNIHHYFSLTVVLFLISGLTGSAQIMDPAIHRIIDKHLDVMGGRAEWGKIKSLRIKATVTQPDGSEYQITILKKRPNLTRLIMEKGQRRITRAYDGKIAWQGFEVGSRSEFTPMEKSLATRFIRDSNMNTISIEKNPRDYKLMLGKDVILVRAPFYQLTAIYPDNAKVVSYIDKDSFLERRQLSYDSEGNVVSEVVFGEFEIIDGILYAMLVTSMNGDEVLNTMKLDKVETNVGLLKSSFSPPGKLTLEQP